MPDRKIQAHFIQPMLLLRTEALPTGQNWVYELKFDGFRAEAVKSGGKIHLRSRNDKDFNGRYPSIVRALAAITLTSSEAHRIAAADQLDTDVEFALPGVFRRIPRKGHVVAVRREARSKFVTRITRERNRDGRRA